MMTNIRNYQAPPHLVTCFINLMEELSKDIVEKTGCPVEVADIGATSILTAWIEECVQFIEDSNKPLNHDLN